MFIVSSVLATIARSESVGLSSSVQPATATATGGGRARGEGARPPSIPAGVGLTSASSDGGGGRGESAVPSTVPSGALIVCLNRCVNVHSCLCEWTVLITVIISPAANDLNAGQLIFM